MHRRPPDVLARFFVALGGLGLLAGGVQLLRLIAAGRSSVQNPVFGNPRRLPHLETMEHLGSAYSLNFLMIVAWTILVVLLALLFAALVHDLYRRAPILAITGGVFLAGSVLAGLLAGTSVLKVAEFVVQSATAASAEQEWLRGGINFMNQLHLFYVSAWFLCISLGWICVGLGAVKAASRGGYGQWLILAGGLVVLGSVLARSWLPSYGPTAPGLFVAMGEPLATVGIGLGLVGCGLLGRSGGPAPMKSQRLFFGAGLPKRVVGKEL